MNDSDKTLTFLFAISGSPPEFATRLHQRDGRLNLVVRLEEKARGYPHEK